MGPAQILEMARAYGLHGRLYVGRPFFRPGLCPRLWLLIRCNTKCGSPGSSLERLTGLFEKMIFKQW